jgi:hypothetical protein
MEENSEMTWKIWTKSKLKCEMNIEERRILIRYRQYGWKASWIVKWYGKCGRKVGWIVKRYEKYGKNPSSMVKRYGEYGRKASWIMKRYENMEET